MLGIPERVELRDVDIPGFEFPPDHDDYIMVLARGALPAALDEQLKELIEQGKADPQKNYDAAMHLAWEHQVTECHITMGEQVITKAEYRQLPELVLIYVALRVLWPYWEYGSLPTAEEGEPAANPTPESETGSS